MKNTYAHRKLLLGGSSIISVIIFLAIMVSLQYIAMKNPVRWDVTQAKQHSLSSQSIKIAEQFRDEKKPIEVLAFYESKDQRSRNDVSDLLDKYRDVWSDIHYSFYDPDKERAISLQNRIESYPTALIKSGNKSERLSVVDEETFTNALVRLQRDETRKVYFLKGHGELSTTSTDTIGFSIAREQIERQNYKTEEIILLQSSGIPSDAAVLVVAGPRTDPMPEELKAIEEFLSRGGAMLVMLNPFQTREFSLALSKYGFELTDDIVVDKMSQALGGDYLMPVITSYAQFPITKNFDVASFFPQARSVRALKNLPDTTNTLELAMTSPVSWTISEPQLLSGSADFDEKFGKKGPIPVMAVSTLSLQAAPKKPDDPKPITDNPRTQNEIAQKPKSDDSGVMENASPAKKARIVVFGSSQFASNKFYRLQGNGDLFMNTISWLAEDENLISVRPKSLKAQPVVLTAYDSLVALTVPVIVTPSFVIVIGMTVFFYRRRVTTK